MKRAARFSSSVSVLSRLLRRLLEQAVTLRQVLRQRSLLAQLLSSRLVRLSRIRLIQRRARNNLKQLINNEKGTSVPFLLLVNYIPDKAL